VPIRYTRREVLSLNVDDLDRPNRRARTTRKGGKHHELPNSQAAYPKPPISAAGRAILNVTLHFLTGFRIPGPTLAAAFLMADRPVDVSTHCRTSTSQLASRPGAQTI
jgi:hypothetical protein